MMMAARSNYCSSTVKRIMSLEKFGIGVIVVLLITGIHVWAAEGETATKEDLYYIVTAEGEIVITGGPKREEIIIPARIDGMPVAGIGENAFLDRTDIETVTVSPGVRYVGANAFAGCEMLKTVTLAEGLQYIGEDAFLGDGVLEEIWLPESVAFVGENAFGNCTQLETIRFPQAAHVDEYAFEGSMWQDLRDQGDFQIRGSCLISAEGGEGAVLAIPYGVTKTVDHPSESGYVNAVIGQYMAYGDKIQYGEILLPETMVRLGEGSFNRTKIDRIIFPESLREIGTFAFQDAILDEVILPGGLKTIDDWAFADAALTAIELPETLNEIGMGAFSGTDLEEIVIPGSDCYVGRYAFDRCERLSNIVFEEGISIMSVNICNYSNLERLQFPESLQVLEGGQFFIPSLRRIYIPGGAAVTDDEKIFRAYVENEVPLVIYGQSGSRAEEAAKAWGMEFVEAASGDEMP